MADVQLEHGYLRVANALDEAITYADFSATHMKIVRCLVRLTYGWQRLTVMISHRDLAVRCGLKLGGGFRRAMEELLANRVLWEIQPGRGRTTAAYSVNKNYEDWGRFSVASAVLDRLFRERPPNVDRMPKAVAGAVGYVYYARDGNLVKIGYSSDPWTRVIDMRTVRPTIELVAIEPGDRKVESDRHQRFAADRVDNREWFTWSPEIEHHVETIQPAATDAPYAPEGADPNQGSALYKDVSQTPQGNSDTPRGGTPSPPNSLQYKDLEARKDIEIQERHTTTTRARVREEAEQYAVGITTAANNAITERWGEQMRPMVWTRSVQLATELLQIGVPLEIARTAIARAVAASKSDEPPKSINYFAYVITDAFKAEEQRALDAANPAPRGNTRPTRVTVTAQRIGGATHVALRSEQERAYNIERQKAGLAWSSAEENRTRLCEITRAAEEEFAGFLESSWARAARDRRVAELCADEAGFPNFEHWIASQARAAGGDGP